MGHHAHAGRGARARALGGEEAAQAALARPPLIATGALPAVWVFAFLLLGGGARGVEGMVVTVEESLDFEPFRTLTSVLFHSNNFSNTAHIAPNIPPITNGAQNSHWLHAHAKVHDHCRLVNTCVGNAMLNKW